MVRIIYEYAQEWPVEGPLTVDTRLQGVITIPPDIARRRANGYFAQEVALFVVAGEPVLVLGEPSVWRIPAILRLRGFGEVATVGSLNVNAHTGEPLPLTSEQIEEIRKRANELAARFTPTTETSI
ncbi:MAG: hypothetical protein KF770_21285 [Anaerolineae bacterium]|nr:hypothetical protein [Anaerolineae bacterium]